MRGELTIAAGDPASGDGRRLIAELDEYLAGLYPAESNHLLPAEALRHPSATFLVARLGDRAAGCGAVVRHGREYVEIKRIHVSPAFRGQGLGRQILASLESLALAEGFALARLETGIHQPEALLLFERAGYHRREPFGDYHSDPLSVFMEKRLGG